jgi:hypothetical protein
VPQTYIIDYFVNKKPQGYTQDWNGLIELLDGVDLETLAKKVKHALATDTIASCTVSAIILLLLLVFNYNSDSFSNYNIV